MSRRIPQSFINDLVARTDLLDLVGSRVSLKRAGSSHKGLCPFHDEKTPSFIVSPDRGTFKCFGCGAYGNAVDFIMRYENREFLEAIEILAEMLHLEIPVERGSEPSDETQGLYDVLREADQFYRAKLRESPEAIAYLKRRGIDGPTASRFALGFAPDAWNGLCDELGSAGGGLDRLIRAGLAVRSDSGRVYDRFRHRIMFPIRDARGRVIGFGGRLLEPGEPKYLNSPDTPLFDKSRTLFGIYEARRQPGRPARIIVVEGYVDVIALDQAGLGPALATMGTAATAENMRQLTRLSDRVVFCFDGDRAGREAAWRAVESILPFGGGKVAIEFVLLPEGEDPDSFVRAQGPEAFEALLEKATPLSSFMIAQAAQGLDISNPQGRDKLIATVKPLINRLPGGSYRELVISELAERVALDRDLVEQIIRLEKPRPAPILRRQASDGGRTVMQRAISLLLHYPAAGAAAAGVAGLAEVDLPGAGLLRQLLEMTAARPDITTGELIESFRGEPEGRWIEQLARDEVLDDETAAPRVLREGLERIVENYRRKAQGQEIRRKAVPPESGE